MVNKICGGIGCILDALQPELAARANPTCQGDERLLQSFRRSKSRLKSLMAMVEDLCHACQKPGTAARPLLRFPALKPDVIKDFFTPAPQGTELLLGEVFLHSSCGLRPPYPEFALKTKSTIFNKRLVKKGPQRALVMLKAEPASYGTDSIMLYKRLKAIEKGIYRMESNQSSSGNGNSAIPNRNASSEGEHGGISVGTHCQSNSHGARADGNAFSGGEEPSPDTSAADGQPRRFQHGQAPVIDARRLASSTPAETRLVAVGASSSTSAATATDTRAVAKITVRPACVARRGHAFCARSCSLPMEQLNRRVFSFSCPSMPQSGRESGLGFAEGAGAPFGGHSITPFPGSASTAGLPGSMGALSSIDGPGGTPRKVHGQQVVTQATSDLSRMDAIGARGADLKSQGLELQSQDAEVRTAKLNTAIEAPSAELKNQGAKPKRALEPEGAFFEVPLDDQDATLQRRGDISKKSRASLSWSGSRPTRNDC
jgi:hypothetical protein